MNTPRTLYALCIATTLTASSVSLADVLTVPSREHPTLQGAIWDAENGDVVNILPGVYNGTLHVSATEGCRAVTLRAAHGPGSVVLQSWAGRHQFTGWLCGDEGIDLMHIRVEGITFAASQRFQRFKDGVHVTHCTADFINCEFTGLVNDINRDDWQPSGTDNHGAVTIHQSVATFTRCTFSNNGAVNTRGKVGTMVTGGAIDSFESDLVIDQCSFNNNYVKTTDSDNPNSASKTKALGGALRLKRGTLRIDDSTFVSNTASGLPGHSQPDVIQGGAIHAQDVAVISVRTSTFQSNTAERGVNDKWATGMGGAVYLTNDERGDVARFASNEFIENHAGLTGGAMHVEGRTLTKANSDRYHCNTVNQVSGNWSDRGRNVFTDCEPDCPWDANGDGAIDKADLYAVIANYGPAKGGSRFDLNDDGVVNAHDAILVLINWNDCDT